MRLTCGLLSSSGSTNQPTLNSNPCYTLALFCVDYGEGECMSEEAVMKPGLEQLHVEEAIEDRRATRDLKFWIVKTFVTAFLVVLSTSVVTLIYAAVIQEKDLDTGFIGETLKGMFEVIRFLLT